MPTTDKQKNNWPPFLCETEYLPFEKKTDRGQIRNQDTCRPRHIRYLQAKLAGERIEV